MELIEEIVNKVKIQAIPQIQAQQAVAQKATEPQSEIPAEQTNPIE